MPLTMRDKLALGFGITGTVILGASILSARDELRERKERDEIYTGIDRDFFRHNPGFLELDINRGGGRGLDMDNLLKIKRQLSPEINPFL